MSGECNFQIDVCTCDSIHGCKEGFARLLANEHVTSPIIFCLGPRGLRAISAISAVSTIASLPMHSFVQFADNQLPYFLE